jgi:hypothetical protein
MNGRRPVMSVRDALAALEILIGWEPPDGVSFTASCTVPPGTPESRRIAIAMSAIPDHVCVIDVAGIPTDRDLAYLADLAGRLLHEAWEVPACSAVTVPAGSTDGGDRFAIDTRRFGGDQ